MADWILPNSSTPGPIPGDAYMDAVQSKVLRLSQGINIQLTGVGGTANNITASLDPAQPSGLMNGMLFILPVSVANTGAVTLAVNGSVAANVVDLTGLALTSGRFPAGSRQLLTYSDGNFIAIGDSRIVTNVLDYRAFTASGTWTKPFGTPADAWVFIEGWGGGGGGRSDKGGGGGGYDSRMVRAGTLGSSVTVTVGSGGGINSNGSASAFGSLLSFPPGQTGTATTGGRGGGTPNADSFDFTGGRAGVDGTGSAPAGGSSYQGGGGGSAAVTSSAGSTAGGSSYQGGGGGGATSGGTSVMAGNGGVAGQAGFTPAGGGGRNAAGARGEVRVWTIG